jgi:hypothetical protein
MPTPRKLHGKFSALHLLADVALLQVGQRVDIMDRGRFRPAMITDVRGRQCMATFPGGRRRKRLNRFGTHDVSWRVAATPVADK